MLPIPTEKKMPVDLSCWVAEQNLREMICKVSLLLMLFLAQGFFYP
jgi:hypothetical protein